jgi:predicted alpha/beta superfamily hydrolase
VLVAGVGWPSDDLAEIAGYRHRDATPTAAPFPEEGFGARPARHGLGGAESFRRFVVDELLPFLAERYRVGRPKVLVGHSLTGLFGVHLLLCEPPVFDAYLLASPSLWWDDRVTLRVIEPAVAARRTPFPARVYLSAGAEEGAGQSSQPFSMVGNVAELARRLAAYEGLDVTFEILDGESHHSTLGQSVSRGLRHLLPADAAPASPATTRSARPSA